MDTFLPQRGSLYTPNIDREDSKQVVCFNPTTVQSQKVNEALRVSTKAVSELLAQCPTNDTARQSISLASNQRKIQTTRKYPQKSSSVTSIPRIRESKPSVGGTNTSQHAAIASIIHISGHSTKEGEIFPAWIRKRKDFQMYFPRFSDKMISEDEILHQGMLKLPSERNLVELQTLSRWIMQIPSLGASLDLNQAMELARIAEYEYYGPTAYVFRKGDIGTACYLVISGEAHIYTDGHKVASVSRNSAFGDIAVQVENATRGADVIAGASTTPGIGNDLGGNWPRQAPIYGLEVLKIMAVDYRKIVARYQTRRRKHIMNWLHTGVTLFRDCADSKLHFFEVVSIDVTIKLGETLYEQGDAVGAFYIVRQGQVRLEVDILYEHRNRWPSGPHEWEEKVHTVRGRIPFHVEEKCGFFGFEMFANDKQFREYTVIGDSPTVELVALNRIDCFSPYFSFTSRAITKIMERHAKCEELAAKRKAQRLKEFLRATALQQHPKDLNTKPCQVKAKFPKSKETPVFQFPCLQPAAWEANNEAVRALQMDCNGYTDRI